MSAGKLTITFTAGQQKKPSRRIRSAHTGKVSSLISREMFPRKNGCAGMNDLPGDPQRPEAAEGWLRKKDRGPGNTSAIRRRCGKCSCLCPSMRSRTRPKRNSPAVRTSFAGIKTMNTVVHSSGSILSEFELFPVRSQNPYEGFPCLHRRSGIMKARLFSDAALLSGELRIQP